jgi:hypothetical protein
VGLSSAVGDFAAPTLDHISFHYLMHFLIRTLINADLRRDIDLVGELTKRGS